jgi:hypothetical protein
MAVSVLFHQSEPIVMVVAAVVDRAEAVHTAEVAATHQTGAHAECNTDIVLEVS